MQTCKGAKCVRKALPRPGKQSTTVTSISGTDARDMWAVGFAKTPRGVQRPLMWRKAGGTWSTFRSHLTVGAADESLRLTQIEVANKSKAFALGHYNYLNGSTSTLYRWNGTDWKELAPRGDNPRSPQPCDGWFNRRWSDLVVRSGQALLVGKCGVARKPTVLEQGDATWDLASGTGFPDQVAFSKGSFVGQEAWLTGTRDGTRTFYRRVDDRWAKVATKGIKGRASVADIAGPFDTKVMAVGWVNTGGGHQMRRSPGSGARAAGMRRRFQPASAAAAWSRCRSTRNTPSSPSAPTLPGTQQARHHPARSLSSAGYAAREQPLPRGGPSGLLRA